MGVDQDSDSSWYAQAVVEIPQTKLEYIEQTGEGRGGGVRSQQGGQRGGHEEV